MLDIPYRHEGASARRQQVKFSEQMAITPLAMMAIIPTYARGY
ncbi:hypothetical protein [Bradyrhizobium sp. BR13661]|jgi:hypothetical protein|nr:hypothetical protein [Bradyrhizobium sp. BR13661]MDH6257919.1 hypothetical protein [Bradyrhizobium sp. BR13661]